MDNKTKTDDAATIVANMALAHEMIMTDNFQLTPVSELENESLVKNVHNIVHQAFWDLLEAEIATEPPQYANSMKLLKEMKQLILEITPAKQEKLIREINEVLDEELIEQEVSHGVFDLQNCAMYIINVLGKLCAPIRDSKVKEVKGETMLVPLLRGIFELLDLMKVDMANYEIQKIKPVVMKQAVDYEREKFGEYLAQNPNGLDKTKDWLRKAYDIVKALQVPGSPTRNIRNVILTGAYLSLIEDQEGSVYPETLLLDKERIDSTAATYKKFVYIASLLAAYKTYAGDHITTDEGFMSQLKDTMIVLLDNVKDYNEGLANVLEQLLTETDKQTEIRGLTMKEEEKKNIFRGQLVALTEPDNQLVKLIKSRMRDYLLLSFASETRVPPTSSVLLPIANEIKQITDTFLRVIRHNRAVFHDYYNDILNGFFIVPKPEESQQKENGDAQSEEKENKPHKKQASKEE